MNVINIEAKTGTVIDLATQDRALVKTGDTARKGRALSGIIINVTNSVAIQLRDGSVTGEVKATVVITAGVGATIDFFDIKFPNGIFLDAGGSATGNVTVAHWGYVKGIAA